ncbi:MBG domain-containing protein [Aquabacter sp. CN5-332]|uniref:MBG domain-containing protein n=1 Tax=Aquabacter sp. CN5-332 TaxID=3156608 RepID=UPI0032B3C14D
MASTALVLIGGSAVWAQQLPTGGAVAAGAAAISQPAPGRMVIDQSSAKAILSWQGFSIGQSGTVVFNNGSGTTLNRVTGNVPSRIDGTLTASGSVYLVNPAGIAVGTTGQVATGGSFIASTHDITDRNFLNGGDLTFSGTSTATIVNAGKIGSLGGDVALIARKVESTGTLTAPNGTVGLAAGYEVLVKDGQQDGGKFAVKVGGADTEARASGTIRAASAELRANGGNVYALAGNTRGVIAATGVANKGGRIYLTAGSGNVETGGTIAATRTARNGATAGGDIRVSGRNVKVTGTLAAKGTGTAANGVAGGTVVVEGESVALASTALVDVSGASGGTALIGGDWQGGAAPATKRLAETVATARTTTVEAGARLLADGTDSDGGAVVVWADGPTTFSGAISARGSGAGNGGTAEVSGKRVLAFNGTADLRAQNGRTGDLLLDPYNLTISNGSDSNVSGTAANGDDSVLNVTTLMGLLATANVTVSTGTGGSQAGDITVAAPITWSSGSTLRLQAAGDILINADITAPGASAWLMLEYGAGKGYYLNGSTITLTGANAQLFIGTADALQPYVLIQSMAQLEAVNSDLTNAYALAQDLDASGVTYTNALIGSSASPFTGTFAGLGHTISNLTISAPSTNYVGLFGQTGASAIIRDVGLVGGSVSGRGGVGSLVGFNSGGSITNVYATGAVTADGAVGGLVGYNTGSITNVYATGAVTSGGDQVGGLVGLNSSGGSIANAYATGTVTGSTQVGGLVGDLDSGSITNAYATGAVTGDEAIGGLVGENGGTITNAYATGAVAANDSDAGGLVGINGGSITNVYATGAVTGAVGGLAGSNLSGASITNGYWDQGTTGQTSGIGYGPGSASNISGFDTADAFTQATYGSFDFANTWFMIEGSTRPFLRSEWSSTIVNAHQLQLMAMNLSASYTLGANIDLSVVTGGGNTAQMWHTATGFSPVGNATTPFSGTFDGAGHTVSTLFINLPSTDFVGLFGYANAAAIRDIGLLGISDIGWQGGAVNGQGTVGSLVGYNQGGSITNAYTTAAVTGSGDYVGGLVGWNDGGSITNARATGAVTGSSDYVGGLVGRNQGGSIINAYATGAIVGSGDNTGGLAGYNDAGGSIMNAYATGTVAGDGAAGGLVGYNSGSITSAYATGAITGNDTTGGLVGWNDVGGSITNAYATSAVTSGGYVGGLVGLNSGSITKAYATGFMGNGVSGDIGALVGYNDSGSISASYWNTDTAGIPYGVGRERVPDPSIGLEGLTTAQFQDTAGFLARASAAGWDFATTWAPPSSGHYPELYALTPVVWVNTVNSQSTYGDTTATVTAATVGGGGPASYVFGPSGDSLSPGIVGSAVAVDPTTSAGTHDLSLAAQNTNATSQGGVAYRVFSYGENNLTVDKAALTVAADNATKTYGQTPTLTGFTPTGLQNGETIGSVTLTSAGSAATASVGGGPYAIVASAATGGTFDPSNYTITYVDGSLTVTPAALTVTASDATKTYGQTATLTGFNPSGLQNGETIGSVTLTSVGQAATASVAGGPYAIMASAATGGTFDPNNYTVTYVDGSLTVNPAALTVTASDATKTYGQTVTLTGFNPSGLQNSETIGSVTLTSAGQAATASVGSGPYAISASAATGGTFDPGNYAITYVNGSLTVSPAALTITADNATKTYGDTAALTGFATSGLQNGETIGSVTLASAGAAATASVAGGPYAVIASAATGGTFDAGNYAITYVDGTLTVNPAALTITADNATKTYGATPTLTGFTSSGLQNDETIGSVTLASAGAAATASVAGGPYAIIASVAAGGTFDAGNYATTYVDGMLTVNPAALTVTADNASKTYGAAPTLTGFTASGLQNGETVGSVTLTSAGTAATASVAGGPYAIVGSAATGGTFDAGNYAITYVNGTLTVNPAALTITADNASKTYGQTPTLTGFTASGLQTGETIGSVTLTSVGTAATASVAGGPYAIIASAATGGTFDAGNYAITYVNGALTVTPRPVTVTANAASRVYGDANPGFAYVLTSGNLVNGDTLAGALATSATTGSGVGSYAITQGTLTDALNPNYAISYVGANLTVTQRPITVTADGVTRLYGDPNPPLTYVLTSGNLVNGDRLSGALATGATLASDVGGYAITQGTLTASGNYALTYAGADLTVLPATLVLLASPSASHVTYGAGLPGFSYLAMGWKNGQSTQDNLSGVSFATTAGAEPGVGGYTVAAQGGTLSGAAAGNYVISSAPAARFEVIPAPLVITATAPASVMYGEGLPAFGLTATGWVYGQSTAENLGAVSFTTMAGTQPGVGTYEVIASGGLPTGAAAGNYAVSYAPIASLQVVPRPVTVTADPQARIYGDANPALTYSVGGAELAYGQSLTLATAAGATSGVGSYGIMLADSAANANYDITYSGAMLQVTPRPITVAADNETMVAGSAEPPLTWQLTAGSLVNGDEITGALALAQGAAPGTYGILQGSLAATANYALTYDPGVLIILPAPPGPPGPIPPTPPTPPAPGPLGPQPQALTPQEIILLTALTPPSRFVQTSAPAPYVWSDPAPGSSVAGQDADATPRTDFTGCRAGVLCRVSPHRANLTYGRSLNFRVH